MSESSANRVAEIAGWFAAHEDGNFLVNPPSNSTRVDGDPATARTILYLAKAHCRDRMHGLDDLPQPWATITRPGLPIVEDLEFLRGSGQPTRAYIGDGDPADLICFAWLREHLPIQWRGVCDELVRRHGNLRYSGIHIPLANAEQASLPLLERVCPDWRELLGPVCSSLLTSGFKIELEGANMKSWSF